jgi:hypothetical protein
MKTLTAQKSCLSFTPFYHRPGEGKRRFRCFLALRLDETFPSSQFQKDISDIFHFKLIRSGEEEGKVSQIPPLFAISPQFFHVEQRKKGLNKILL